MAAYPPGSQSAGTATPRRNGSGSAVVVAERLTKHYGGRLGIDGVSFEARAGEVLGLLGPNGSGKTTILRILTGYLQASSGRARVAGFDIVEQGLEARRRIGYVPEDVPLYTGMRVDEFLAFMGKLKGLHTGALKGAIEGTCVRLGLDTARRLAIGKLSRGYRQRVMIAQALLNEPEVLVLDEPTNGLDPRQIIEVRELIRSLAPRHTILVTSHILGEIERVATRVAILLNGRLLTVQALEQGAGTRLRLQVRGAAPDAVRAAITGVPGVVGIASEARLGGGVQDLIVQVVDRSVAETVAMSLAANGFGLLEMTEARPDLEALFLDLTAQAAA